MHSNRRWLAEIDRVFDDLADEQAYVPRASAARARMPVGDIARQAMVNAPSDSALLMQLKGRTVVDRTSNRVGVVMDVIGGSAYLRPVGGGIEWQRAAQYLTDVPEDGVAP